MGLENKTMVVKESTIFLMLPGFCISTNFTFYNFHPDFLNVYYTICRFNVRNGKVTYQSRYVNSTSYVLNTAAGQLLVPEFTTPAAPDPCKTIFHK